MIKVYVTQHEKLTNSGWWSTGPHIRLIGVPRGLDRIGTGNVQAIAV
jgi:hypothetical protein